MEKTGVVIARQKVRIKVRNCNLVSGRQGEFEMLVTIGKLVGSEMKEFTPPACMIAVYGRLADCNKAISKTG
jgi:hypothetical protein